MKYHNGEWGDVCMPALGRPGLPPFRTLPTSPGLPVKAIHEKVRHENQGWTPARLTTEMRKSTRKKPVVLSDQLRSDELRSEMMTVREVASYLHCRHYFNVYWLVHQGALPGFRLGGDWRFRRSDVDQWIAARQVQPPPRGGKKA